MALSNAERQKRFRQRLKARASNISLYDAMVDYFRSGTDSSGLVRVRPGSRKKMTPEQLAWDICSRFNIIDTQAVVDLAAAVRPNAPRKEADRIRLCMDMLHQITAIPEMPDVT